MSTYELTVTEMMWRLTDQRDLALDIGANVGYFTSLLAYRARKVIAFEPHPGLAASLRSNAARWPFGQVEIQERAASDVTGLAQLTVPPAFDGNSGAASLRQDAIAGATSLPVEAIRLDDVVEDSAVGALKVDVEGHELAVFDGLSKSLGEGRVRDVYFEDYEPLPTTVSELLVDYGYEIFSLQQRFRRVELGPADGPRPRWYAPTYFATLDPERAKRRAQPGGWRCLRPR